MQIELRPIDSIRPYDKNPRLNDGAVQAVARSPRRIVCGADESWRPVPRYEDLYEVSSYGRVRRVCKSRMAPAGYVLKPRETWDGYVEYGLCRAQQYWYVKAHRLVALAFLGPRPFEGAHIAHHDGDKYNNHPSNLRWATPKENEADKRRQGRMPRMPAGDGHPTAKLSSDRVQDIRRLALSGTPIHAAAERHGVAMTTAYSAVVGKTWRTVIDPPALSWDRGTAQWMCN